MKPVPKKYERLEVEAKRLGATTARIVPARNIVLDRRVRLKCSVPLCDGYGRHLLCPPNVMDFDDFERAMRLYRWALLVQVESDFNSLDKSNEPLNKKLSTRLEKETGCVKWQNRLHDLVNRIETSAFKRGYYLAAGLIGGDCALCEKCVGQHSTQPCRHPFRARPSMQAMGIDVVETCRRAGLRMRLSSVNLIRWTGIILLE